MADPDEPEARLRSSDEGDKTDCSIEPEDEPSDPVARDLGSDSESERLERRGTNENPDRRGDRGKRLETRITDEEDEEVMLIESGM